MNQLVEAWKGIADVEGEASPPLPTEPQSSPKGIRLRDLFACSSSQEPGHLVSKKKKVHLPRTCKC